MRINKATYIILLVMYVSSSFAQSSKKLIHDGNQLYEQKKYSEAESKYRKSLSTKENALIGNYNLGNTLYQEGKIEEAKEQFQTAAADKSADKEQLSRTYHNLGNSYLKSKKYPESIESYKQALKLNPKDNDTRYNLAYAQSMLQQQQQQQKNDQNKDNKDKDNKDKDKNKQDKDKQNQEKEQQQKDQQSDEQKQADQQKAQPKDKISKEDAEKILQALNNDEKKTQKKLNIKQPVRVSIEKQW
jgi:Ca-activated chloride channel family protein